MFLSYELSNKIKQNIILIISFCILYFYNKNNVSENIVFIFTPRLDMRSITTKNKVKYT